MSTFLDSSFFIALLNDQDKNHHKAVQILDLLKDYTYGKRLTTDYILDEVVTGIWGFTRRKSLVEKSYQLVKTTPDFVLLEHFPQNELDLVWKKWLEYAEYPKRPLSFTDCTILVFMEIKTVDYLVSFDSQFNGLVFLIVI